MSFEKITFRNLRADEIEVRVGATTRVKEKDAQGHYVKDENGKFVEKITHISFLLFKDARDDMAILDETFGCMNWQAKYYQVKNTMICSVGINVNYNDPTKPPFFIWKDNGGDDDFTTEQVKAECSDSFKRACFLIGIGRGLYSASKLYMRIPVDEENTDKSFYGCKEIEYDDNGNITKVVIYNKKTNKEVLTATLKGTKSTPKPKNEETPKVDKEQVGFSKEDEQLINRFQGFSDKKGSIDAHDKAILQAYLETCSESESQKFLAYTDKYYHTMSIENLSEIQGKDLVSMFKNRGK